MALPAFQWDHATQCCRVFTLALPRLSCCIMLTVTAQKIKKSGRVDITTQHHNNIQVSVVRGITFSWFMCFFLSVSINMMYKLQFSTNNTTTQTATAISCLELPQWAGTRKVKSIWISLKQETVSGSSISWAICKSAPRPRQITTPAPHHSVDTVGWAARRAFSLKKNWVVGALLVWLSIWKEVQICIWSSWWHSHSLSLAPVNTDWFYLSGTCSPG